MNGGVATLLALSRFGALVSAMAACTGAGASGTAVATSTVDFPASYEFAPAAITVHAGPMATRTNDDPFMPSVRFLDDGLASLPDLLDAGRATSFTFARVGVFHDQCSLHPQTLQGPVTAVP
ncbi:MAG TPA: hypothetical protein VF802_02090 [Candidatus Limnocylindrales bacterium]